MAKRRQQPKTGWRTAERLFRVAIQGGPHPITAKVSRTNPVGNSVDVGHQWCSQFISAALNQILQPLAIGTRTGCGINGDNVGASRPDRLNLLPARGDVDGTLGKGSLPEADDQSLGTATAHGPNVLRTFKTDAHRTIPQGSLSHGRDDLGVAHRRTRGGLNGDNQAPIQDFSAHQHRNSGCFGKLVISTGKPAT